MEPDQSEVHRQAADGPPDCQPDLFSRDQLPRGPNRRRAPRQAPRQSPPDEWKEAVHEVLEREFKAGDPPETESPHGFPDAEWLPARMLNEFVYCPRLFFYEHVDGVFVHNADTERGKDIHSRVDKGSGAMPAAGSGAEPETIHSRSVQMGSACLGVTAKLDLVESEGSEVSPVDYKAGSPREGSDLHEMWPTDRMQLGLQMLILRENGYPCERGYIYYRGTRQRVPLDWSGELCAWIEAQVNAARTVLREGVRPPPLTDSPKCPRCSLVSVCLPDETRWLQREPEAPSGDPVRTAPPPRRLIAARDDSRALYLNTPGLHVGIRDRVLDVREEGRTVEHIRLSDVHHVALFGNIQISTQTVQRLCQEEIPLTWFSTGGWFYGITRSHGLANILLRRAQFQAAADSSDCLALARRFVSGKIRNSRTLLMRNAVLQPLPALQRLRRAAQDALDASSLPELLGIEGAAAAVYFSHFSGMIKTDDDEIPGLDHASTPPLSFDFHKRNRRPPADPVNAMLSYAYSLLAKDCTVALLAVGFDPWMGFCHQPRPGRPALALDLMEEFRPLIAESTVLTAINNRMVTPADFVRAGDAVNLSPEGRKHFLYAYEQRMNHLLTHPVFAYKVSYRRAIELQARLLARVLEGEIPEYLPLLTR